MRAALCKDLGGPGSIVIEDIDQPVPGPDEVLIKVHAAALNFADTLMTRGKYQFKPEVPFSPGAEVSGVIEACGQDVSGFPEGTRVLAFVRWNGCREKVTADVTRIIPIPDGVSDDVASSVTVTYGTAIHGLKDRAALQAGETLAVTGASGGAGLAALEIGKLMGARTIAVASSDDKLALCKNHGADELLNYSQDDLKDGLKALTDGRGVDVIYDCVGGDSAEAALRAMAWEGRFLVVGFASGEIPKIPINLLLLKGCSMMGVFWSAFVDCHPDKHRGNIEQVLDWCAKGRLTPHIEKRFPLDDTAEALKMIDERRTKGKIVVCPNF